MEGIIKVGTTAPVVNMGMSTNDAIKVFLSECDIRNSSKNVYRRGLQYFFKWVENSGRVISELTRADILVFKDLFLNAHSNLSIAGYLVALRRFMSGQRVINSTQTLLRVLNLQNARTPT